jgi:ABC-type sugar transport systems, permease components
MVHLNRVHLEEKRAYWAMVMPAFALYLLVMAFPIILSIMLSVSNYSGGKMFGGRKMGIRRYFPRMPACLPTVVLECA